MDLTSPITALVSHVMDCSTKHLNYLRALGKNLDQLKDKMAQLNELKSDVNNKVIAEETRLLMVRTNQVNGWMQRVEARGFEVDRILFEERQHHERRCLNGCCPMNCWSSYKLGKKVIKNLKLVEKLKRDGVFEIVAENPPLPLVQELPENFIVGLDSVFERALNLLEKDDVQVLGLYGVGGVGKTTLLKKINNELPRKNNDFDIVIWVVISSEVNIRSIQEAIGERLGLQSWRNNVPLSSRASVIFKALKMKRFLLLLDDVWKEIDLQSIGIPLPSVQNKSKIVLTARTIDVCSSMGAHYTIKVEFLNKEHSWILLQQKIGPNALNNDPQIPMLAEKVAEKCHGLPLALITIGASMASKTNPREWKRAISDLNKCSAKFPGMEERVLHLLKFSYDRLPSPTDQVCFLFCALYPEDNSFFISDLIEKWIGAGYIHGFEDFEEALNMGHGIVGTLKRACLLENGRNSEEVKMHDMIRELALWIAREYGRGEGKVFVKSGLTLTEIPISAMSPIMVQTISLIDTRITNLGNIPNCPNLSTFFAPKNHYLNHINDDFFLSMPALKFLDLSFSGIAKVPTSICELFELEFLDLTQTKITSLPCEIRNLRKLKYLSFIGTKLCIIPRGMMMNFSNLEILKLEVPISHASDEEIHVNIDEFRCLNNLKALGISISFKDLEKLLNNPNLCNCVRVLGIKNCKEITLVTPSSSRLCLGHFRHLQILVVRDSPEIKEWIFVETKTVLFESLEKMALINLPELTISWNARHRHLPCAHFRKLTYFFLCQCDAMVNLTWLLHIPNLQTLEVDNCGSLQEILSSDQDTFSNLKVLDLRDLPNLCSISSMIALPFPSLETIHVAKCPKLRRLPNSAKNTVKNIYGEAKWWNGLEWENETIKTQFAKFFSQRDEYHLTQTVPRTYFKR
ncbi:hypothetical protein AQUCO_00400774v1 [Aquilegia coerulea]|uniref:AAA+ ATPase domain-containing protein n=1 Tax=Aquilegia coerulea TaxID=218851 RepID=A0A2G5EWS8_AQUCA|nr:hypothetical protein AQUCO_00400774v1 [Aquilegia coerulea]